MTANVQFEPKAEEFAKATANPPFPFDPLQVDRQFTVVSHDGPFDRAE
ncbi:hypothetical protein SAMN05444166_4975 [Singulisphaera sp. GP187]|nr:hypothetical protein [Singulisphaera sp. GP187]SIO46636.1 hypothetical protein SAMN05444166_4975 [Singulisphaera sp. GP187]